MSSRSSLAGFLFVALPACLFAQDATVTGIVTDSAQALMPGVHITIRNVETGIARTVQTNSSGNFTITSLAPGHYELSTGSSEIPLFTTRILPAASGPIHCAPAQKRA
jgi:hypothetical protein